MVLPSQGGDFSVPRKGSSRRFAVLDESETLFVFVFSVKKISAALDR